MTDTPLSCLLQLNSELGCRTGLIRGISFSVAGNHKLLRYKTVSTGMGNKPVALQLV